MMINKDESQVYYYNNICNSFNIMMHALVGTAYHEILSVPFNAKEPINRFGDKIKSDVVSLCYDDENNCVIYSDAQHLNLVELNQEKLTKKIHFGPAYDNPHLKIIKNYQIDQSTLLVASDGNLYPFTQEQTENSDYAMQISTLSKPDPKHFYRAATYNDATKEIAIVGKGVPPFVYSHSLAAVVWKGKNAQNDELDLQVPMDDVDCCFIRDGTQLAVANANEKIRIYDIKTKRKKALFDHQLQLSDHGKARICKMEISCCGNYLYIGKQNGSIFELDLNKNCRAIGKYKGITTSIRDIKITEDSLIAISLDCYIRVFDRKQKTLTFSRYLNAHPTKLIVFSHEHKATSLAYEVQEESEQEQKKPVTKVKQIRKRNKVGLRYLQTKDGENGEPKIEQCDDVKQQIDEEPPQQSQ